MSDKRQVFIDGDVEKAFTMLRDVPLPDSERVAAKRSWLLAQTAKYRESCTPRNVGLWKTLRLRRPMMARLILAIVVVVTVLAGGSGLVYAADTAAPGDPLWHLDQEIETLRLRMTGKAMNKIELLLSIAEERLEEAEALAGAENAPNREAALNSYGATVATLARAAAENEDMDTEVLSTLIDTAVSGHEMQLSQIMDDGEGDEDEGNPCEGDFIHPAAQRLAEKSDVAYERVIGWFCDGYGIGEIMLALKTAESTGENPGDLLILKTASGGWGEVWQERGLHGKPENAGPPDDVPGKPEDAGPPDDVPGKPENAGPPDDVPGNPEDDEGDEAGGNPCDGDFTHPAVEGLAEDFDVAYDIVLGWFCEGYGIGDIKLALETAEKTGADPGDLLAQKTELGGWGEVWQEWGLIGNPDDDLEKPDDEDEGDAGNPCDGDFTHPAVEGLAEDFNVAYDIVLGWFCEGYGIGDIKLALETAERTGADPGDLLAQKTELGGWGEVWQEWGLIGKPKDAGPPDDRPGKPDDAGPPDNAP